MAKEKSDNCQTESNVVLRLCIQNKDMEVWQLMLGTKTKILRQQRAVESKTRRDLRLFAVTATYMLLPTFQLEWMRHNYTLSLICISKKGGGGRVYICLWSDTFNIHMFCSKNAKRRFSGRWNWYKREAYKWRNSIWKSNVFGKL